MTNLTHSYSSLKMFENCPKRYYHQRITKEVKDIGGTAMVYGENVHKALEDRLRSSTALPAHLTALEPLCATVEKNVRESNGELLVEEEMTLTDSFTPTGWWDSDAWFRSKIDVLSITGGLATTIDWKTGKVRPDFTQLDLFALQTFIHKPQVDKIVSTFVWTKYDRLDNKVYKRDDVPDLLTGLTSKTKRIEQAVEADVWPAKPSGLCGWCPCKSFCTYAR